MDDSVITCDEITDGDTEPKSYHEAKSYDKETKTILTNFNEKSSLQNTKLLYFTYIFINYNSITDSCQYLLLSDKNIEKMKNTYYNFTSKITN